MYKVLAIDIDETISTAFDFIPKKNIQALRKVVESGRILVFVTGRPRDHARKLIKKIFLNPSDNIHLIAYNGGYVENIGKNEVEYIKTFTAEETTWLHKLAENFNLISFSYCSFDYNVGLTSKKRNWFIKFLKLINKCELSYFDDHPKAEAFKIELHGKIEQIKKMTNVIQQEYPEWHHYGHRVFSLKENFYEFMPPHISKEKSLSKLLIKLNLSFDDVLAIGNGNNDIGFLKAARKGVAVANANSQVRKASDEITKRWYFSGVAHTINKEFNFK